MAELESGTRTFRDVVCSFCGLGCDDLVVEVEGREVRAKAPVCPEAARLFRRQDTADRVAGRNGQATSQADACTQAQQILAASRAPVFAGLGTDIDGGRAVLELAAKFGGVIDHAASEGLFRNYTALQRTGWLSVTLAEVRNRCDVLLVVGGDPTPTFGRLFERLFPENPLFAKNRRVIFLGGGPGEKAREQLAGVDIVHLPTDDLVEALEAVAGAVAGHRLAGDVFGGIALADILATAEALKGAAYAVVTWNAAELTESGLIAERATGLIDTLNVSTRAGVFPLGGRDNIIGLNQLMLWTLGYPLRTAIRGGTSEHDSTLFSTEAALADADTLVWISAFRPEPPPAFAGKVIVLGHPDTVFENEPDIFIPVATPGIDHAGTVFRMDSIVSLPLGALRVATLPSVAEAVRRIAGG